MSTAHSPLSALRSLVGVLICLLVLGTLPGWGQSKQPEPAKLDWKEAGKQKLAQMDVSTIRTDYLLNLGLFEKRQLDAFRQKPKNAQGITTIPISESLWRSLYNNLVVANVKITKPQKAYTDFVLTDKNQKEQNAVIPIGILDVDATLLDSVQTEENIRQKSQGKKADTKKYESVYILAAAPLQEDVYQADVQFRLSPDLLFGKSDNKIKSVELDFQDGKGFRFFSLKEQLIRYTYSSVGVHGVTIKLRTDRGIYQFQTQVNVNVLRKPNYDREINLTAKPVKTAPNGRVAAFTGGTARVVVGCDGVFDRPIIIAEGFDPQNNRTTLTLVTNYITSGVFTALLAQGYDFVFLDYNNGSDYIQNNAQVLISLINEVNRLKSGNSQLIVIGESMGGLVARYALTEMEKGGPAHNVSHYISFDAPHRGANVPIFSRTLLFWAGT